MERRSDVRISAKFEKLFQRREDKLFMRYTTAGNRFTIFHFKCEINGYISFHCKKSESPKKTSEQ